MLSTHVHFDVGNADVGDVVVTGTAGRGLQTLSQLYDYEVMVEVEGDGGFSNEAIDDLLNNPVRVTFGEEATEVHGVIRELEMLSAVHPARTSYRIRMVPKLWYLTLTRRNRAFHDKNYLDIVKEVLTEHGMAEDTHFEDRCNASYPSRNYTVQHDESDFNFVSRLLEYHGIHYHFEMSPDGELLVLGDDNSAFEAITDYETLTYVPRAAADEGETVVTSLRRIRRPRPQTVAARDYNWRTPTTTLRFEHAVDEVTGRGLVDLYGDHVRERSDGDEIARLRAEQLMVTHDTFIGKTGSRVIFAGARFELTGHPNPDLDQEYVITSVQEGLGVGDAGGYEKSFEAIPASVPFRPQRYAAWPRLDGLVNAKVTGETRSTMTPIDDEASYTLIIPFREGGAPSRLTRRSQPSAGSGYGMHLPLHIGTECVVAHINGDPDRPIIVGAVPNTETESPVVESNATHSRIKTGSGILIELDDDC